MKCPRDNAELFPQEYESGIFIDVCTSCGSTWLDKGELEKIEDIMERDYEEELSRIPDLIGRAYEEARQKRYQDISCPKCSSTMEKTEYAYCSQIMVDRCPSCGGIWLDKGELELLEIFYERSLKDTQALRLSFLKGLITSHR